MTEYSTYLRQWYNLMMEIRFQLSCLHDEVIDTDDFANAIEEIYWKYTEIITKEKTNE